MRTHNTTCDTALLPHMVRVQAVERDRVLAVRIDDDLWEVRAWMPREKKEEET